MIDPRAIIHPSVVLAANVSIGPWTIVGADVEVGERTRIEAHAVLHGPARIGRDNHILPFASLGASPSGGDVASGRLVLGDRNVIREGVSIDRGSSGNATRIGSDCILMPYARIGHDCDIGDRVELGSHAVVEPAAKIGPGTRIAPATVVASDVSRPR